jgi:hypothetical protein
MCRCNAPPFRLNLTHNLRYAARFYEFLTAKKKVKKRERENNHDTNRTAKTRTTAGHTKGSVPGGRHSCVYLPPLRSPDKHPVPAFWGDMFFEYPSYLMAAFFT